MKALLRLIMVVFIALLVYGCSAMFVNPRQKALDDIISMSQNKVGDDVIKRQIDVTHSTYRLKPQEISALKKTGVSDDVIKYMLETDNGVYAGNYSPWYDNYYDYYFYRYYTPYYYNPWYYNPYHGYIGRFYDYYPYYSPHKYWDDRDHYYDNRNNYENNRRDDIKRGGEQENR